MKAGLTLFALLNCGLLPPLKADSGTGNTSKYVAPLAERRNETEAAPAKVPESESLKVPNDSANQAGLASSEQAGEQALAGELPEKPNEASDEGGQLARELKSKIDENVVLRNYVLEEREKLKNLMNEHQRLKEKLYECMKSTGGLFQIWQWIFH